MTEDMKQKSADYLELSRKILTQVMEYSEKVSMLDCALLLIKGGIVLLTCCEAGKTEEEQLLINETLKKELEEVIGKLGEITHEQ